MSKTAGLRLIPSGAVPLTADHKRFNQLLGKIDKARSRLASWHENLPLFAQAHAQRVRPMLDDLAASRRAWLAELDAAASRPGWARAERHTLAEVICDLAAAMIDNGLHEADAPALKAVYNRHSEVDFDTEEQQQLQDFKGLFETVSGMDLGDDDVASHDELLRRAHERLQAQAEQSAQRAERKGRARKPSAAQARREEEARQVKQTVREVFRKLVSALHPDRASDAADRDARTAMMQRVNRAYEADDLLALLQLQLEIEQVDLEHVARASAEQVRHFNRVLAEQLAELDAEIADCQARFCAQYGLLAHGRLDPLKLGAVVDDEVRELRAALAVVERDRKALLDRAAAKRWLKKQRRAMRDAYFDDLPF